MGRSPEIVHLWHWAGGFRKVAMWGPVVATPLIVVGILLGVVARDGPFGYIAAAVLAVGVVGKFNEGQGM